MSAGELSGDKHGAQLAGALRALSADSLLIGMGGSHMAAAGVRLILDVTRFSTVGIFEGLPYLPRFMRAYRRACQVIREEKPDLLIAIDAPGFNEPLARFARKCGIPVLYFIAPEYWCWGTEWFGRRLKAVSDGILSIHQAEERFYQSLGCPVTFVGHPVGDIIRITRTREDFRLEHGVSLDAPLVGIFPGSREREIRVMLPEFLQAAAYVKERNPRCRFLISAASAFCRKKIEQICMKRACDFSVIDGDAHNFLHACDFSLLTCGTISLEAAMLGAPHLVAYKLNRLTYFVGSKILSGLLGIVKNPPYKSLANIVLQDQVIPEFMQERVSAVSMAQTALRYLDDRPASEAMKTRFSQLQDVLGRKGCYDNAARAVLVFLGDNGA